MPEPEALIKSVTAMIAGGKNLGIKTGRWLKVASQVVNTIPLLVRVQFRFTLSDALIVER